VVDLYAVGVGVGGVLDVHSEAEGEDDGRVVEAGPKSLFQLSVGSDNSREAEQNGKWNQWQEGYLREEADEESCERDGQTVEDVVGDHSLPFEERSMKVAEKVRALPKHHITIGIGYQRQANLNKIRNVLVDIFEDRTIHFEEYNCTGDKINNVDHREKHHKLNENLPFTFHHLDQFLGTTDHPRNVRDIFVVPHHLFFLLPHAISHP
jgi:hypothetical protein